jgi:hypothetical protein
MLRMNGVARRTEFPRQAKVKGAHRRLCGDKLAA